ncbi:MAG: flagellin [Pirellulaceae bacterium]|jgi:flagellin-like hook-associated protein FlgL|nr:flagellin [Pirellulaceae bacterium]
MADTVTLTAAVRTNLLTLQRTADLIGRTQTRLATGLKVNSALDDASAFFSSRALSNRASDLATLKGDIDQSVSSITAALNGIDGITELIEQAKGLANSAKGTGDTNERSTLAVQFNALLDQVDNLANDASFGGANLLQATPDNLEVTFNEDNTSNITVTGIDSTTASTGINVSDATSDWANDTVVNTALTAVNSALTTLRTSASTLGSNNTILQARLSFTENLVNTLEEGAGKLTLADLNEESANLLALQTRQQLGINSLALAAQSERSVLALFG